MQCIPSVVVKNDIRIERVCRLSSHAPCNVALGLATTFCSCQWPQRWLEHRVVVVLKGMVGTWMECEEISHISCTDRQTDRHAVRVQHRLQ